MKALGRARLAFSMQLLIWSTTCKANEPPKFVLDGRQGSEIVLRLTEGAPIGGRITRLKGIDVDGDTLIFGTKGPNHKLVNVVNMKNNEADIFLAQNLDHEEAAEHQIILTLTDGHLGKGNYITQSLLILVEDANDNPPIFISSPASISVEEHSSGQELGSVEAVDADTGAFGQVVYKLARKQPQDITDLFSVHTVGSKGILKLNKQLDYEIKSLYQVVIEATDRASIGQINSAFTTILIKVQDIEDQPPQWINVASVTRIPEDIPLFSPVLEVLAIDGDTGINNAIKYSITAGATNVFAINEDTGLVYSKDIIDRESGIASNGAFILEITAREDITLGQHITTEVTIIIEDVNDESPQFGNSAYVCEISENSPAGTPVTFLGQDVTPEVFDYDQGTNGTFRLRIEGDGGAFEVTPTMGINQVSFMIRVLDTNMLDYELVKEINLTVVATEVAVEGKQSSAAVTVYIRDNNDNSPNFIKDQYHVFIPEDIQPGATIAWIQATDADSGLYGSDGVRYTGVSGQIAGALTLNKRTGVVSMGNLGSPFDREKINTHYLTIEVRDNMGIGNRNTVELVINLIDVNDNAPKFRTDRYEMFLMENSPIFSSPFVVEANDNDQNGTENSQVRYKIVSGDYFGNFTIDAISGEINPRGPLDFEVIPGEEIKMYNLTVRAYDLGTPSLWSDILVVVYITDRNDNAPVFGKSYYKVSIPEDTPGGTPVIQVQAKDGDGSQPNNQVVYRIQTGARDKFVINPQTGMISVSLGANLDPDLTIPKTMSYYLEVSAIDGGIGSDKMTTKVPVNITISDVNNKLPRLVQMRTVLIQEDANVGTLVAKLKASDLDEDSVLRYGIDYNTSEAKNEDGTLIWMKNFDYSKLITVNDITGELHVGIELDRETIEEIKLNVLVEDVAATAGRQIAYSTCTIIIQDVNDNNPQFTHQIYTSVVTENIQKGANILNVAANDLDKNRTIQYEIEGQQQIISILKIDSSTGLISVQGKIDRETLSWLNFSVRASDNGIPRRSANAEVHIKVIDENDNTPQFNGDMTSVVIPEDAAVGHYVAKVTAYDLDSGEFGKITYFLDNRSSLSKFKIDPDMGEIKVSEPLDREEQDVYNLIVQAYDNYQTGFSTGQSRNAFLQLNVIVSDVNDEIPEFMENDNECSMITEFHEQSEGIVSVRARDRDDPTTPNGNIGFTIWKGNHDRLFRIENIGRNTAKIYPNLPLKGHYGNYSLIVEAKDKGYPSKSATATYSICVQDFNDNAPVFVHPPKNFSIRISENASVGSEVIRVRAIDTDIGSNGEIRYRIRKDPLGAYKVFDINSETGSMVLNRPVDRERQKLYEIRVEAYDQGIPTPLQTDLDLTIYIKDVNDHDPQFIVDQFVSNFTENKSPGSQRTRIINTVDLDDEDEDARTINVCYFLVGGNDGGHFSINPTSHELMANVKLDREEQSSYILIIKATEECLVEPEPVDIFDPGDDSLLSVIVYINDVNDNPPKFDQKVFTGGISTDIDFGTSFMQISATDLDDGLNSIVEYSIYSDIVPRLSEGMELVTSKPFAIEPITGEIILNFDPQTNQKGYFDFTVAARDIGNNHDYAQVYIYLLREDQRVKFVMRSHPEEIRSRLREFRSILSNATDAIVNVDHFKIHQNNDGSVDKTKTDVLLHFVNPHDNTIMEVDDVIQALDYRTEDLNSFFKDFNVLQTEAADASFFISHTSTETVMIFWLIGTCIFLTTTLIVVICICIHQRSRYNRRLKAATTTAYDIPTPHTLNKTEVVPNTNIHATEGSNPVWMTGVGYDNWGLEDTHNDAHMEQQHYDNYDSLDANVLNDSYKSGPIQSSISPQGVLYSENNASPQCSTLIITSKHQDEDKGSESSGRGSGSRLGSPKQKLGSFNHNLSTLFSSEISSQEKIENASRLRYDEIHNCAVEEPRTEL